MPEHMMENEFPKAEKIENVDPYARRFKELSEDYDLRYRVMDYNEEFQSTIKNTLKDFANAHPDQEELVVLEAGTGTGITTIRMLDADSRIKVIAVENEKKMIEQAEKALDDMKERITFVEQDILSKLLEMSDGSIDAFASGMTLHNFPADYREKVIKEVARVLKSGGLFVNADKYAFDNDQAHRESLEEQIKSFDKFDTMGRPDVKKGWTEHYRQDEHTKITQGEQIKMLEGLGFEDIKVIFRKSMEATITAIKK